MVSERVLICSSVNGRLLNALEIPRWIFSGENSSEVESFLVTKRVNWGVSWVENLFWQFKHSLLLFTEVSDILESITLVSFWQNGQYIFLYPLFLYVVYLLV